MGQLISEAFDSGVVCLYGCSRRFKYPLEIFEMMKFTIMCTIYLNFEISFSRSQGKLLSVLFQATCHIFGFEEM